MRESNPSLPGTLGSLSDGRHDDVPARPPELLAPAGDWDCARAAVENGADAIYFGLDRFNARMRAQNFTEADLPELMQFLHRRGVRGYVTFNTLVFANELADAEQYIRTIIAAGVDAAIVQDVGICRLIRRISPDFPIHASTQMTVTSAAGVEFVRELGCNLVVLARECSIAEVTKIRSALQPIRVDRSAVSDPSSNSDGFPLEVFVHGALCVAYSGQCLTSESLGGRSANRGECAQACRMPYELISDGQHVRLGDKRYLLSPQDLAGLDVLSELIQSGVASLKIEGRLKTPEYVANITKVYRTALDRVWNEHHGIATSSAAPSRSNASLQTDEASRYRMEMAFSRGLYSGWFRGINNQQLVHARFGKKRGVFLGKVQQVRGDAVCVALEGPLKPGDGIVFDAGRPDQEEQGGRVYRVTKKTGDNAWIEFGHGAIDFHRVRAGDRVWKTSDPELDRQLRQTFAGHKPNFQRPLTFAVHGRSGQPLTVVARDELGHVVQVESNTPLVPAEKQPLTTDRLLEHFGRLGGTPFQLAELENLLDGDVILPMSDLNRLRRDAVQKLEALRSRPKRWRIVERTINPTTVATSEVPRLPAAPELIVLVRSLPQVQSAIDAGIRTLYCELEDPKKYRDAVALVRAWNSGRPSEGQVSIFVAPPRIFKMGEDWILNQVLSSEADGYLVRNYDHLHWFSGRRQIGDFSLNVANPLTAEFFIQQFGFERITASYDLNPTQLEALLRSAPPQWFEITIHQHMPMFHMEHCVFCAFLSTGTDYRNCGRPCDKHQVKLRDRVGAEHPLKADAGCRNTVFNAVAQTGAESVAHFLALGARAFRLEFLNEAPELVGQTIRQYQRLLRGEITGATLWRELKLMNQLGVTRGRA